MNIDLLTPFFREGVDLVEATGALNKIVEANKPANPLDSLTKENAYDFIHSNSSIMSVFDKKVSKVEKELREKMEDSFESKYLEKYNLEHPPETDQEKRLREIEKQLVDTQKQAIRSGVKSKVLEKANELKLSKSGAKLLDFVVSDDEENSLAGVQVIYDILQDIEKDIRTNVLKENAINPESGGAEPVKHTKDKIKEDIAKAKKNKNWGLVMTLKKQLLI